MTKHKQGNQSIFLFIPLTTCIDFATHYTKKCNTPYSCKFAFDLNK